MYLLAGYGLSSNIGSTLYKPIVMNQQEEALYNTAMQDETLPRREKDRQEVT